MSDETPSTHLNLWKKHLGRVPDTVWQQTSLETLVLAENELTEISKQVGQLKKLRMLDLGHNRLTRIPDALGELDGLNCEPRIIGSFAFRIRSHGYRACANCIFEITG